jgi:hypothetical protein
VCVCVCVSVYVCVCARARAYCILCIQDVYVYVLLLVIVPLLVTVQIAFLMPPPRLSCTPCWRRSRLDSRLLDYSRKKPDTKWQSGLYLSACAHSGAVMRVRESARGGGG